MEHLFVYGTLGPGRPNEHILASIGGTWKAGSLRGRLVEAGWGAEQGYPALVLTQDGSPIHGHVFASENLHHHWSALDEFEGSEYKRSLAAVTLDSGEQVTAYVYELDTAS